MDEKEWDKRPPAKMTLTLIQEKEKEICELREKNQHFELSIQGMGDKLKNIEDKVDNIGENLTKFIESADKKFVNYDVFSPVRKLVYGATGVVLTLVVSALVYLIIKDRI